METGKGGNGNMDEKPPKVDEFGRLMKNGANDSGESSGESAGRAGRRRRRRRSRSVENSERGRRSRRHSRSRSPPRRESRWDRDENISSRSDRQTFQRDQPRSSRESRWSSPLEKDERRGLRRDEGHDDNRTKKQVCFDFSKGRCYRSECRFSHGTEREKVLEASGWVPPPPPAAEAESANQSHLYPPFPPPPPPKNRRNFQEAEPQNRPPPSLPHPMDLSKFQEASPHTAPLPPSYHQLTPTIGFNPLPPQNVENGRSLNFPSNAPYSSNPAYPQSSQIPQSYYNYAVKTASWISSLTPQNVPPLGNVETGHGGASEAYDPLVDSLDVPQRHSVGPTLNSSLLNSSTQPQNQSLVSVISHNPGSGEALNSFPNLTESPLTESPPNQGEEKEVVEPKASEGLMTSAQEESLATQEDSREGSQVQPFQKVAKGEAKIPSNRGLVLLRARVAECAKESLKESWRSGGMTKETFKMIARKAVEKVIESLQPNHVPRNEKHVEAFMTPERIGKIDKLVKEYVKKVSGK